MRKDVADAQKAGLTGTPAFFVGVSGPGSRVRVLLAAPEPPGK